jgi:prepilin-type processing-associated H-X9-DG protein
VIDSGKAKDDSPLAPALKLAAAKHAAVVAIDPEQLEKLSDELPADAEPFKPLLKAKLGTLVLDAGTNMKGELRVKFPGAGEAKAGAKAVEIARKMALELIDQFGQRAGKMAEMEVFLKLAKQAGDELKRAKVVQDGATVSAAAEMKLDDKTLGPVLGESLAKVRAAAARMQSSNNLKQIALAMHNYESANGHFPPAAVYDKDGKALLSWRVLLLPYLEQDALYREFKLDEAWDSPHNKKLLAKMPALFQVPNAKPQHAHGTFYQVLYGKGAAFEGKTGNTIVAFTDGTSNTILAVESDKDVPWSKPEDVPFDDAKDVPRLGDHHGGGLFMAAFADGSVRAIKHTINKDALKALITRAGGEVIGNDD